MLTADEIAQHITCNVSGADGRVLANVLANVLAGGPAGAGAV